mmetsp:Transcript_24303/g.36823  ORF Transcript_24303/g.36823 Transcript_24303/m.36823 type:complete len:262 (+) Transcript_24303:705-1490(+)
MQRMMRNLILGNIIKRILQSPISNRVTLGQATPNRSILKLINPRPLKSLPPRTSINHTIGIQCLQSTLEWFHLAHLVVLFNILLPQVGTILCIIASLVSNGNTLGTEYFGLESIKLLNLTQEIHSLREEVEGIHNHNLGCSILEISHAVQKVGDDDISGNHGIGKYSVTVVLNGNFQGEHGLFLEVLEAHFFGFGNVGFLVKDFFVIGHTEGRGEFGVGDSSVGAGGDGVSGWGKGRDGGCSEEDGGDGGGVGFHDDCCWG